ncbi:MAG: energy transducer TonB [Pseudomonadota bacterium]
MFRSFISLVLGALVTLLLVIFMAFMVKQSGSLADREEDKPIEILIVQEDEEVKIKQRVIPKKPPPPKEPPPPETVTEKENQTAKNQVPQLNLANLNFSLGGEGAYLGSVGGLDQNSDGEAVPIVRIEPQYPQKAALEGKEGFVTLSFTIMPDGSVGDISVLEAKPRRLFDRAARRALSKWKYKPKIVDGKPVPQPGQKVTLDFKLDS